MYNNNNVRNQNRARNSTLPPRGIMNSSQNRESQDTSEFWTVLIDILALLFNLVLMGIMLLVKTSCQLLRVLAQVNISSNTPVGFYKRERSHSSQYYRYVYRKLTDLVKKSWKIIYQGEN